MAEFGTFRPLIMGESELPARMSAAVSRFMPRKLPSILALLASALLALLPPAWAEGDLDTIRSDVRNPPPESPSPPPPRPPNGRRRAIATAMPPAARNSTTAEGEADSWRASMSAAYAVTAPFWLPRVAMHDDSSVAYFPRFPYDNTPGYLKSDAWLSSFASENILAGSPAGGSGRSRRRTIRTPPHAKRRAGRSGGRSVVAALGQANSAPITPTTSAI